MGNFSEVRNNYYNEEEHYTSIDAWVSDEEDTGMCVALVYDSGDVVYLDPIAKEDVDVQASIKEVKEKLSCIPKINLAHLLTLDSSQRNLWLELTYTSTSETAYNCSVEEIAICGDSEGGFAIEESLVDLLLPYSDIELVTQGNTYAILKQRGVEYMVDIVTNFAGVSEECEHLNFNTLCLAPEEE